MINQLQAKIFCHDLINPPIYHGSCNIDLQLSKSDGLIDFKRKLSSSESAYIIRIPNIQQMGFTNTERIALEFEYRNLILACNLVIPRACITNRKVEHSTLDLIRGHKKSESTVKKIGNTFHVNLVDSIEVNDSVHVVIGFVEKIEENQIVEVFRKLQKINRYGMPKSSAIYDMNLNSSLAHYQEAMSESSKLFKFKYIFNALEMVTNIDGINRMGYAFDTESKRLDPTNCMDVEKWRKFYNRTKHVQRNFSDIQVYEEGEKDLPQEILCGRRCIQKLLLSKLN